MLKKNFFMFILLILMAVPMIQAEVYTNYTQVGGFNNDFRLGESSFNSYLSSDCGTDIKCSTRNIGGRVMSPLVADLDNDGINEIIINDGSNFRLYHGKDMEIVDSYPLGLVPVRDYFIAYDIDGDNYTEIIADYGNTIYILKYNGSHFFSNNSFTSASNLIYSYLACKGINNCILAYKENTGYSTAVLGFNSTGMVNSITIDSNMYYFPQNRNIQVADTDNNGDYEYIFNYILSSKYIKIAFINQSNNGFVRLQSLCSPSQYPYALSDDVFTSLLVMDIDGSISNGQEIIIGLMDTSSTFKIYSYDKDCNLIDDYPETAKGSGILVSNPFRAKIFPDDTSTDGNAFCVMGFDKIDNNIEIVCGDETTSLIPETYTFDWEVSGFNVTAGYELLTHAVQTDSSLSTENHNPDEILTSYGVFGLDYSGVLCVASHDCDMSLIWENPKSNGVVISADVEYLGFEDLLVLQSNNIWYIDDGYTNNQAYLGDGEINPCVVDNVIKTNTTVQVQYQVLDVEGDTVNTTTIIYYGTPYNQSSGWVSGSSGTTFNFLFTANHSALNQKIRIYYKDDFNSEHTNNPEYEEFTFSVSDSATTQYGDCTSYFSGTTPEESEAQDTGAECEQNSDCSSGMCVDGVCVAETDNTDNAIVNAGNTISHEFEIPKFFLVLFVLLIATYVIAVNQEIESSVKMPIIALIWIVGIVAGAKFGFISTGLIVTIVILSIAVAVVFVRRVIDSSRGG